MSCRPLAGALVACLLAVPAASAQTPDPVATGGAAPAAPTAPAAPAAPAVQTVAGPRALLNPDGTASAPVGAPAEVVAVIAAANRIAKLPYRYGGGHGAFTDTAYDCSGSVSYALHGADLIEQPVPSGSFRGWGRSNRGRWISVYANGGHMYMVVAGLRFDTSGRSASGSRWQAAKRSAAGFFVRHPPRL